MKTIHFEEIIECSSQQSLLTGQAGFGIRTLTEGMDEQLAQDICEQIDCAYVVDIDRQVTAENIARDATIVKQYPRTLKYTSIQDNKGQTKYIIACSTYVGIDYGYFCNQETARRTGTNYIADILVFDEKPSAGLFYQLVSQQIFLPIDNTCSPDNPELKDLLTGEPSYLKPRSITLEDAASDISDQTNTKEKLDINEQTALLAIALLQAHWNEKKPGERRSPRNIVIQAEESKTLSILKDLAILPNELVIDKYFQTNYLQGYGMPNGYRMIFLNEFNQQEVYIDNYVYVNLDGIRPNGFHSDDVCPNDKRFKNVDTVNLWYSLIRETAKAHDYLGFQTLIEFALHDDLGNQDNKPEPTEKKSTSFWKSLSRKLFNK